MEELVLEGMGTLQADRGCSFRGKDFMLPSHNLGRSSGATLPFKVVRIPNLPFLNMLDEGDSTPEDWKTAGDEVFRSSAAWTSNIGGEEAHLDALLLATEKLHRRNGTITTSFWTGGAVVLGLMIAVGVWVLRRAYINSRIGSRKSEEDAPPAVPFKIYMPTNPTSSSSADGN